MRQTLRDSLRSAWHGPLTAAEIASREGVNGRRVQRFWAQEKKAGRLPTDAPRPHFIDSAARDVQVAVKAAMGFAADDGEDDAVDFTADTAPIGGALGVRIPAPDPLLAALNREHAADCWRHVDGMPADVLKKEADGVVPARWRVAQFAMLRDAFVSALMRLVTQRQTRMIGRAA
jgi:hypothetical protein